MRARAATLARGGLDAVGFVRSPFTVDGKQRLFAEPPHMQASMLFLPARRPRCPRSATRSTSGCASPRPTFDESSSTDAGQAGRQEVALAIVTSDESVRGGYGAQVGGPAVAGDDLAEGGRPVRHRQAPAEGGSRACSDPGPGITATHREARREAGVGQGDPSGRKQREDAVIHRRLVCPGDPTAAAGPRNPRSTRSLLRHAGSWSAPWPAGPAVLRSGPPFGGSPEARPAVAAGCTLGPLWAPETPIAGAAWACAELPGPALAMTSSPATLRPVGRTHRGPDLARARAAEAFLGSSGAKEQT